MLSISLLFRSTNETYMRKLHSVPRVSPGHWCETILRVGTIEDAETHVAGIAPFGDAWIGNVCSFMYSKNEARRFNDRKLSNCQSTTMGTV